MGKHSRTDEYDDVFEADEALPEEAPTPSPRPEHVASAMRLRDLFAGRRRALEEIAAAQLVDRTTAEAGDIARLVRRTQRAVTDVQLLEQNPDASPRLAWRTGQPVLDDCQQPGCHQFAGWFVRFQRDASDTCRRLCHRDAARRIRRRTHTTSRRDTPQ